MTAPTRRRLISRRSVVAFIDGPQNVAGPRGGGSRPGQLASLPASAGGGLVVFENNHRPGVESRGGVTAHARAIRSK